MPQQRQSPQPQADASQVFMMFFLLIFMLIIFTPELREWMGTSMGGILEPLIGFDHMYPVLTIFLAGMVMIILSTTIRHFFIDWMEMARIQKMMFAFNKELREAQISRNQRRVDKLMELQPEVMKMNAQLSSNQMKPMMFTMLVAIPIFMWLNTFISDLSHQYVTIPWETSWYLKDRFIILPHWVLIYSFLSLPVGQIYMRWLKTHELQSEMSQEEEHIEENTASAIASAESIIERLTKEDIPVEGLLEEMKGCRAHQRKSDFKNAIRTADQVKRKAKDQLSKMETAKEHLRSLEDMRKVAERDESAERDYREAKDSFDRGDFASSMYYAKQAKKVLIEGVAQKEYRDAEITRIRDTLEEESLDPTRVEECIQRAIDSRERDDFDEHIEQAEREVDNAIKEKGALLELKDEIVRKIQESEYSHEFEDDIQRIDDVFMKRDYMKTKKYLEEINLKILRRIKGS